MPHSFLGSALVSMRAYSKDSQSRSHREDMREDHAEGEDLCSWHKSVHLPEKARKYVRVLTYFSSCLFLLCSIIHLEARVKKLHIFMQSLSLPSCDSGTVKIILIVVGVYNHLLKMPFSQTSEMGNDRRKGFHIFRPNNDVRDPKLFAQVL